MDLWNNDLRIILVVRKVLATLVGNWQAHGAKAGWALPQGQGE